MRTWQQTQVEEWFQELKVCQVSVPSANKSNLSRNIKQIVYNLKTYSPKISLNLTGNSPVFLILKTVYIIIWKQILTAGKAWCGMQNRTKKRY